MHWHENVTQSHTGERLTYHWTSRRGGGNESKRWSCCGLPYHSPECVPFHGAHPGMLFGRGSRSGGGGGGAAGSGVYPPAFWSCCGKKAEEPGCVQSGQCLCGRVCYDVFNQVGPIFSCDCDACLQTGRANGNFRRIRKTDIRLKNQDSLRWHETKSDVERGFCRGCGMTVFWQREEKMLLVAVSSFVPMVDEGWPYPPPAPECALLLSEEPYKAADSEDAHASANDWLDE